MQDPRRTGRVPMLLVPGSVGMDHDNPCLTVSVGGIEPEAPAAGVAVKPDEVADFRLGADQTGQGGCTFHGKRV